MPRNLDRRVELLYPVEAPSLLRTIVDDILKVHLRDNVQARRLLADGTYERLSPGDGPAMNSQEWFMTHWREGATRTEDSGQPIRFWGTDD
jgi:polyphosphate kinase